MLCESCNNREANVHYKSIFDGKTTEHHLCEICAIGHYEEKLKAYPLYNIFGALLEESKGKKCKGCGMSLDGIKASGKIGCGLCYESFGDEFRQIMKGIQGHSQHTGKFPKRGYHKIKIEDDIEAINNRLLEAIDNEEFEKAAVLRDELKKIRNLSKETKGGDSLD